MKPILTILILICTHLLNAQQNKPVNIYLGLQFTKTLQDVTKGNNQWGVGSFLSVYGNTGKLRPLLDITGEVFLEDDKVGTLGPSGERVPTVEGILSAMAGGSFSVQKWLHIGIVTGPVFGTGNTLWAFKPLLDITPGKGKALIRLSYYQTGKRVKYSTETLSTCSIGVGFRLFGKQVE